VSTTSRILLGFLLFLATGLYFLVKKVSERVERQYLEAAEESMVDVAQLMAAFAGESVNEAGTFDLAMIRKAWSVAGTQPVRAQIYSFTKTSMDMNAYVTDRRGVVLFDSDGGNAEGLDYWAKRDVALTLSGEYGARSTRSNPQDDDSSVMFVGAPIKRNGEIIGMVSVSKPQVSLFGFRNETVQRIRMVALIYFGLVAAGAYLVITLFSRPIRQLTQYARAVTRGERVTPPSSGSPEALMLGRAFEEMRDALEDRRYVRSYVQTLTHEMKSPVAAIRGASELLHEEMPRERRDKFLTNIQAESRRLQNIIDRLLALSALEARKTLEYPEPVALAELAEGVRAQLCAAAESHNVQVELFASASPSVSGEPFLLEIALTNLLQNALDFASPGDRIQIHVRCPDHSPWAEIEIQDEGPGIPDYALPRLFDRFYSLKRPETGRKSSGLGLCFVREAVELHGGTVTITNRSDRSGVRATMRFSLGHSRVHRS
jgi:two-component system sensor histidine kinase CreC